MANEKFTKSPAKFLSIFVERMVPDYVREDHPMFITFLRKYFEYLERETGVNGELGEYNQITELIQNVDVDHALDMFIPEFEKQYLHGTPHTSIDPTVSTTDKSFLTKNIQPVYRQKGTESALQFLFRRDFDTNVETLYPKQWMMKASGSIWYEPQWITVLTDLATTDAMSEYYNETENVHDADTVRAIYNKKIIGQISGATAFVDMDEIVTTGDYQRLLLTDVNGTFVKDEPIWEDVGTLGTIPYVAIVISEGIRTEGQCIVNGHSWLDKWLHISGHPNEIHWVPERGSITGTDSGATAQITGIDVDYTKMNLLEVEGEFLVGEKIYNTGGSYWNPTPTESFCTTSESWPVLGTFTNQIDCLAAMHPEAHLHESPYYGEPAFLAWYPLLDVTTPLQSVENDVLVGITSPPDTRETCEALANNPTQPNVNTSVWKTNGYWLDSAGFLSSDRKLQDNDYYQDFSYVVKSQVPIQSYREVLKKLVHPVGLKLFAEFSFQTRVDMSVEMPTDYVKFLIYIFSYLDVAVDIWDQESEQHGTLGHAHTGFDVFLEKGFEEYVIEMLSRLENRSSLISPVGWSSPGDHLSVLLELDSKRIGTSLKEKLYTISWLNDTVKLALNAYPEKVLFEFYNLLKVLPITEFPPSVTELVIRDDLYSATDGRMISCEIWELGVFKALRRMVEWVEAFMPEAEYAPEKSYGHFESNREDTIVQKVYGVTNDVIDSVEIQAFEAADEIHSHGRKNGFAPLVATRVTKGLELPNMTVGTAAFHDHAFNDEAIPNLIVHGTEQTASGLSHTQARALISHNAFEIPEFNASKHTTAFLPEATNHVHWFEEDQVVDRQRGRTSDCLTRQQARDLIDGVVASVTLYDNVGKLDNGSPNTIDGVFQGGTIDNSGTLTAHYHEYTVTYDADWATHTDFQGTDLTHGFVYTPVTTWVCYNFRPELIVDENIMGGGDWASNSWPQNVFTSVDDSTLATFLSEPSFTFQHTQAWSDTLNPDVDWVRLYSSNFIASVPGSGDTGDLVGDVLVTDQVTDIATMAAYPMDPDKIAIVDQSGLIYLLHTTTGVTEGFFDLTSIQHVIGVGPFGAYDERGCLGLAFHPDYANNGKLYVYYMTEQGPATGSFGYPLSTTVISEFTANVAGASVDVATERILLTIPQPDMNHNGGEVKFGPDGMLYIGLGDGGSGGDTSSSSGHGGHGVYGNAQNPSNLLGTILRIDPTEDTVNGVPYTIPADNPFAFANAKLYGDTGLVYFRPEIWAYGLRNPWRFSFDTEDRLWCADVGQNKFEEINIIEAGGNYGWRVMEAYHYYEEEQPIIDQIALDLQYANTQEYLLDLKQPIHEYSHGTGISITGGFVYQGSLLTGMVGKYIFGDWSSSWAGDSGHIYSLEENLDGLTATFDVTPNAVNGANHSHQFILTPAHIDYCQTNPSSPVVVIQSDNVHSEQYVHTFSIIWNATFQTWNIIGQTNPEGHDVLSEPNFSSDVGWTRKALSFWDPVSQIVTLTTHDKSLLTMGEDSSGEIYLSTRLGINTFQGSGPNNTAIYKLTETFDSSTETPAQAQIPASETAHVHGYQVTYDPIQELFEAVEISDIEMTEWDSFYPIWEWNDPQSHIHPVIISWSAVLDEEIVIGSSAGWHYNSETGEWEPYDTGADTPWSPEEEEGPGEFYIETAPILQILGANEYGENTHLHYFDSSTLDTFGANTNRLATPFTRVQAQELANGVVNETIVFSSITDSGNHLHYHKYKIMWNLSTQQFVADEVEELWDVNSIGEYSAVATELRTHEHTLTMNGILTHLGWNGTPLYSAPDITLSHAHDWDNLAGSQPDHLHAFNNTVLDTIGVNVGRISIPLDDNQATDLINGEVDEVMMYSSIANGDHYHGIKITYDDNLLSFVALDVEKWESINGAQFYDTDPRSHAHPTNVSNLSSRPGFNELLEMVPDFGSPGYPYPGGSHPHFHNGTLVGPFAWNNEIAYCDGLTIEQGMQLIDGVIDSVIIYDSIEGAHFHEYVIKWDDPNDIFYCESSITWIRGGIEDALQDTSKYYVSVVENLSEGLHWHNLTIEWNPNLEVTPQQTGGSIYVTKIETSDEVLNSAPNITTEVTSTELSPVTTTYPDTPDPGDTTIITTYSDLVTTIETTTIQVTTTTTTITYYSNGTDNTVVGSPVITYDISTSTTAETVEDLTERKTWINGVLQANNPPIVWIEPSFIEGEGSHDHLLFTGCTLDTEGPFSGRMCEPVTLAQANELVNAQDANYGFIFFDSPNGADSHYHGYTIKFNPNMGQDGTFVVDGISQYDIIAGTGTTVHTFLLSGGYHDHDYWLDVPDYVSLLTGQYITTPQRDTTHAAQYTHELVIEWDGSSYNIVSQTSDYDNHNLISYTGSVQQGGEWTQSTAGGGLGDHEHNTIIDDSNVWPVPPS